MSRMTARVGNVTTPNDPRQERGLRLRAVSNSPSSASFLRRASSKAISAPIPAGSIVSITIW